MNKLFYLGYYFGDFHAHVLGCGFAILNRAKPIYRLELFHFTVIEVGKSILGSRFRLLDVKIF